MKNVYQKAKDWIFKFSCAGLYIAATPITSMAQQQPVFDCAQASYVIGNRNIGGANVSDAYTLDLSTGVTTLAKSPLISSGVQFVNAIGYNPVDNYIWGHRSGTNQLVRIGSDFSVAFFTVTGPTGTAYATGEVGPDGILYLYNTNAAVFTKVDLNPGSASYLVAQNVATTATLLNDWAFNPADGKLYGFGTNKILYQFDPVSGARTTIGAVTGGNIETAAYGGSFGTAFFDSDGNMFVGNNDSGAIFKIAAPLNNVTASLFSTMGIAPGDGARCANATVPVPLQAVRDSASVACESRMIDVLANDVAGDAVIVPSSVRLVTPGTSARVTSLTIPGQGSYTVDAVTGAVTFSPVEGFVGTASVAYVVADADGFEDQASVVVTGNCPVQPTFPCSELSYVIGNRNIGGSNVSDGYTLDLSTGNTVPGKQTLISGPDAFINAIGYNAVDNYIWGFRYNTNQLVRIGSDWSVKFYDVTGFRSPVPGYTTGDVGPDGILYLYATSSNQITKIDLNPGSANYLTAVTVPTTPTELNDWSFNPMDGLIYAFGTDKVLYSFDPATGTRTTLGAVSGSGIETSIYPGAFGTAFFDSDGDMYVGNNGSGAIFKIGAPLTNLTASLFSTATGVTPGDGARCPGAIVNDPPVAVDDDGTTTCNATTVDVLANDVAASAPLVASSVRLITPGTLDRVTTLVVAGQGQYNVDPVSGAVSFTPLNGLRDTVSVDYVVTDGNDLESIATVTIIVDCPMPVKLVKFDARKEGNGARLTWSTTEEVNSDRFEVERSSNGKNWSVIGIVRSNGASITLKTYQFTDETPLNGENLYRLRMVDKDETFAFSRVRSLTSERDPIAYVYPNPATDKVFLNTAGKSVVSAQVVTAAGAVLSTLNPSQGYADVSRLPAGVYLLQAIYQDGSKSTFKFIRVK